MTKTTIHSFDSHIYERDIYQDQNQNTIYDSWLTHANERNVLETVLEQRFEDWCPKNSLSILELGCGSGSAARRIFNILAKNNITYHYTGIDPYQDQLHRFCAAVGENTQITLQQATSETYIPTQTYDLALVVHSLYYVPNLAATLTKINSSANQALIIHHGEAGINTVQQRFQKYVKPGPNIISTHRDITNTLDHLDINYTCQVYPTTVDIRPCKDPTNPHGRNMIKFFVEHSQLSEEIITEVSSYFQTQPDYIQHDMAVIVTESKSPTHKKIENYFI